MHYYRYKRKTNILGNEEEIIFAATDLLADTKLAPELSNEAHYYRAKANTKKCCNPHPKNSTRTTDFNSSSNTDDITSTYSSR